VERRAGDGLFLQEQAGADFNLAADAEGIDALVAGRYARAGPNCLPLIVLCAAVLGDGEASVAIETDECEASVVL